MIRNIPFFIIAATLFHHAAVAEAEPGASPEYPNARTPASRTENDDDPPISDPVGMRLKAPDNFSLHGLKPVNILPTAQLQLTSAVMTNSDIADKTLAASAQPSTYFFNGANLNLMPQLGKRTWLAANVSGGFIRFDGEEINDFDTLNAKIGILQQFDESMSGELGWRYDQ